MCKVLCRSSSSPKRNSNSSDDSSMEIGGIACHSRAARAANRGQSRGDLFPFAVDQRGPADMDHVAVPQDPQLNLFAVDPRPIGASQIGEHDVLLVILYLDVEATDPLVVQLDRVAFFATDRHRRQNVLVHMTAIGAIDDP